MKKRIHKILPLLLALALTLSLTACGGSSYDSGSYNSAAAASSSTSYETSDWAYDEDYGYYEEEAPAETPASSADASEVSNALDSSKAKMVYTAHLEVEVLDLNEAISGLNQMVAEMGGYYQSSDRNGNNGSYRYANFTVRIPAERYRAFVDAWSGSENYKLISAREDAEDVGTRYFDIETRLETLRNKMDRLQALLAEATEMEDIIYLEEAISDTEYQIELYASDLNRYDSLINYSTVYITMEQVIELVEPEPEQPTFGQRISKSFVQGLEEFVDGLEELAIWIVYNFIGILIFAAVVVAVIVILRKAKKRGGKRPKAKAAPEAAAPAKDEKAE